MIANPKPALPKLLEPAVDPAVEPTAAAPPAPDLAARAPTPPPDPFDISGLRLNPSFLETAGVKRLITTVPVRKPSPQDFCRVNPAEEYRDNFAMIDLKDDREEYVVHSTILPELTGEVVYKTVFTAVNRQGVVFLWPVRIEASDERKTAWPRSAREAAEMAMTKWIRMKANMSLGAYEITVAETTIADPVWPEVSFQDLVRVAFRERVITTLDHPVIKRLRGLP
jgi:hypothetical protein